MMGKIITGQDISRTEAASFIATLNQMEKHHIGYCATDSDQVLKDMNDHLTDIPFESSFVGAMIDDRLIGLVGCDVDIDGESAEVWGPFVDPSYHVDLALVMWDKLQQFIPVGLKYIGIFPHVENKLAQEFAEKLQFKQRENQMILTYQQGPLTSGEDYKGFLLLQQDKDNFISLHDQMFPNTYYSGQEIHKRIDHTKQVFLVKDFEHLIGYAYAEAEPAFGNGSVEFIAVDPAYRGQGYGKKLLEITLQWLFSFKEIKHIELCVSTDKQAAIGLYRSTGFKVKSELYYYSKEM